MYHSQDKQDEFLHKTLFKDFKNGFFVDVGAHDGVKFNNTLFFEKTLNWTGINIEPLPDVFKQLQTNRPKCTNLQFAVDSKNGHAKFLVNSGHTEMLSGLVNHYDPRHKDRLTHENTAYGCQTNVVVVQTQTLSSIFQDHKVDHVHYLSIDVEGAEMAVIQSIDFDKVFIDCIQFENNYKDKAAPIIEYLQTKGYKTIHTGWLDIFMLHEKSKFVHAI